MPQAIHPDHEPAHDRSLGSSVAALAFAQNDGKKHLLLAATGSVATIKLPAIIDALSRHAAPGNNQLSVRVVLTNASCHFLDGQSAEQPSAGSLLHMPGVDGVYRDGDEWGPEPWKRGAPILHIELRRWAHLLMIAPLSADALAKVVNGLSDNLLLSVVRAWDTDGSIDGGRKRILVAPAMNTAMWRHPVTRRQMRVLEEDWGVGKEGGEDGEGAKGEGGDEEDGETGGRGWFEVIQPISKILACGDSGSGAMASVETIVKAIEVRLGL